MNELKKITRLMTDKSNYLQTTKDRSQAKG